VGSIASRPVRIALSAAATILVLVLVPAAIAAKGGNGKNSSGASASSLTLRLVSDSNSDGQPNAGDTVTFDVLSPTSYPTVTLDCYQDGAKAFWASANFYDSGLPAWMRNFTLSSTYWTGGAADCTATLTDASSGRVQTLATRDFSVAP
jgi:hypothetical protein